MDEKRSENWFLNAEEHHAGFTAGLDASVGTIDVSNLFSSDLAADEAPRSEGRRVDIPRKAPEFLANPCPGGG